MKHGAKNANRHKRHAQEGTVESHRYIPYHRPGWSSGPNTCFRSCAMYRAAYLCVRPGSQTGPVQAGVREPGVHACELRTSVGLVCTRPLWFVHELHGRMIMDGLAGSCHKQWSRVVWRMIAWGRACM